jgi:hypothetical protein
MTVAHSVDYERRIGPFTGHDQGSILMLELVSDDLTIARSQRLRQRAERPKTGLIRVRQSSSCAFCSSSTIELARLFSSSIRVLTRLSTRRFRSGSLILNPPTTGYRSLTRQEHICRSVKPSPRTRATLVLQPARMRSLKGPPRQEPSSSVAGPTAAKHSYVRQ